jgi:tetratricopeptide (TPR) repeat protein
MSTPPAAAPHRPPPARSRGLLPLVLALPLALALPARAQPRPAAARTLSEDLQGPARVAFDQGRVLFEHGDYLTAHAKFRQAHELSGDVRLVWNMAACSSKQKRYARAIAEAERYLAEGRGVLSAEQQERARAFLAEMRTLVVEATLVVAPDGASVTIDGDLLAPAEGRLTKLLELGAHDLRITKGGFVPLAQTLTVTETGKATFAFALEAVRRTGRIVIETDREATIAIDGVTVARGYFEGELEPGAHAVRISRDGQDPYDVTAQIAPGTTKQLSISLRASDAGPWWPWALGGAVLVAGAAVGGYYLFKPEDRRAAFVPGTAGVDIVLP